MKIIAEGTPNEIAALIDAIQELQGISAIKHKRFQDLTTEDFAKLTEASGTTVAVETSTEILL